MKSRRLKAVRRTRGKRRRTAGLLLPLACILLLNGCWNRRELDQISIVIGLGVDKARQTENAAASAGADGGGREGTGPLEVTAQIVLPSGIRSSGSGQGGTAGGQAAFWNLKNTASSVFVALREDTHVSNKKLYLAHTEVAVFGRSIAEEGIADYLDYFMRDPELRPGILLFVAEDRADDILDLDVKTEKLPAMNLKKLATDQKNTSQSLLVRLIDFAQKLNSEYTAPVAPLVRIKPESTGSIGSGGGILTGNGGGSGESRREETSDVSVSGLAVFHRDVMVGTLDPTETRGLLWATGEVKYSLLTVPAAGGKATVEIFRAKGSMKPEIRENGSVSMQIKVTGEATLGSSLTTENLAKPEKLEQLQGEVSKLVEQEIRTTFQKAKEMHADIFGFNETISGRHPKQWEKMKDNWEQVFQEMELKISVDIKIRDAGGLSRELSRQEGKP